MKRFDKIQTLKGAGGLLRGGLIGTILIVVSEDHLFIAIGGNRYHVKPSEVILLQETN